MSEVIIHIKTKDINKAKINPNTMSSLIPNKKDFKPYQPYLSNKKVKEVVTDEIAISCDNWGFSMSVEELFNLCMANSQIAKMYAENKTSQ
jgi:hypothetical protein